MINICIYINTYIYMNMYLCVFIFKYNDEKEYMVHKKKTGREPFAFDFHYYLPMTKY